MAKFDIVTIGGVVKDHTLFINEARIIPTPQNLTAQKLIAFEYGEKFRTKEAYLTLGGGAANSAVSLSRLGLKTAIITRVGKDEALNNIIKKLKKEKINTKYIQLDAKHLTGFSFIISPNKKERDRTIFHYIGCGELMAFDPKKLKNLKTNWFYLSSLAGDKWQKNLKEIFSFAKKQGIKIFWNPGNQQIQVGRKILASQLRQANILSLNKDEAIELVLSGIKLGRKNPNHLNRPVYLLNILREWGPRIVIITEGRKGAWAYDGKKIYRQKIISSKAIDKTGVGDCFGSSFLAGFINENGNIARALKWAIINSASVVSKVGAQNGLLTKKELKNKLIVRKI
ncbi:carbohydrate kinase family protein [Candidatus Falkowbacteria bacterium]|nr:carbohydrate kinase family protein [Candidatus Falkowbacteria bacterium]